VQKNKPVATMWICGDQPEVLTLWAEEGCYRWREADGSDTGVVGETLTEVWENADYVWRSWHVRGTRECPYCDNATQ